MPYSYVTYTGNGSTDTFAIPFSYIEGGHVTVTVNGVAPSWVLGNGTVSISPAPATGATVEIRRKTTIGYPLVDFSDGATLTAANLDLGISQLLNTVQECRDDVTDELTRARIQSGNLPVVSTSDNNSSLFVNGGVWNKRIPSAARTHLGLGTAATRDTGITDGTIPLLSATGLPAVSGQNLTNVGRLKYLRAEEQQPYNQPGGVFSAGGGWQTRKLNTLVVNEIGAGASLDAANFRITLPAGNYRWRAGGVALYIQACLMRLEHVGVGQLGRTMTFHASVSENNVVTLEGGGVFTLSGSSTLQLDIAGQASSANANALGVPHGFSPVGNNIYSYVEIWKVE